MIIERTWELTTGTDGAAGFSTPLLNGWFLEAIEFENPDASAYVASASTAELFFMKRDGTTPGRNIAEFDAGGTGYTTNLRLLEVEGVYIKNSDGTQVASAYPSLAQWRGYVFQVRYPSSGLLTGDAITGKKVNVTLYLTDNEAGLGSHLPIPPGFCPTFVDNDGLALLDTIEEVATD